MKVVKYEGNSSKKYVRLIYLYMKFKNNKKMNHTQDQNRNRDLMKWMKARPL